MIIINNNNLGYQLQWALSGSVPYPQPSGILAPGSGATLTHVVSGQVNPILSLIGPFPLSSFNVTSGTKLTVSITVSD